MDRSCAASGTLRTRRSGRRGRGPGAASRWRARLATPLKAVLRCGVQHFEADIELWDWVPLGAGAGFPEALVWAAAVARQ